MENSTDLVHGLIHLPEGHTGATGHRDWLAAHGLFAAVGPTRRAPETVLDLYLATRANRPVHLARVGEPEAGLATDRSIVEWMSDLTSEVGGLVEFPDFSQTIGDDSITPTTPHVETAPVPVLLVPGGAEELPALSHTLSISVDSAPLEDWTLIQFSREIPLEAHDWKSADLPAVWVRTDRSLAVQHDLGAQPQIVLRRLPSPDPVLSADQVPAEGLAVLEALADPHLSSLSEVALLEGTTGFESVEPGAVARALQTDQDTLWTARVLAALGLPTGAADVAEGRTPMPGTDPESVLGTLRTLEREADTNPVAERLVNRLYGTSSRHPLLALSTIIPEILVGVALLIVLVTADTHPWWHWLVAVFALGCLTDAAIDSTMMVKRLRRRR